MYNKCQSTFGYVNILLENNNSREICLIAYHIQLTSHYVLELRRTYIHTHTHTYMYVLCIQLSVQIEFNDVPNWRGTTLARVLV